MAKRRMFSLDIIDTDLFLEMPQTTRLLYYELCMRADDDGFVSSPKKIQRMVGCNEDDFRVLITKQFIIPFDTGIVVIKHWKIHNYIQKDRYKETIYIDEKSSLIDNENGSYELLDTKCIQNGYTGKDRLELELGKDRSETLYDVVEKNFQRTLSPLEYEEISKWEDNDLTKYAIKQAVLNGARSIKYINTILATYKSKGILSVEDAIKENEKFKNRGKKQEVIPEWFNEKQEEQKASGNEKQEMEDLLKEFM